MSDIEILCSHCKRTFDMPRWVIKQMYDSITTNTPIPKEELELFKFLSPDIDVIFDVGARTDIDYKLIKPSVTCHLFEPDPVSFKDLHGKVQDLGLKDMYLNNHGISDEDGEFYYDDMIQSFRTHNPLYSKKLRVQTLEWYCKENKIDKIDFLKTDTEGWDLRVILGAINYWPNIKYIQYEHWNDDNKYRALLGQDFDCEYVGYRNGLCLNKKLLSEERRAEVIKYIRDNKLGELQ